MGNNTFLTPPLNIPRLNQEQDPTATDMRAIQQWGSTVPGTFVNYPNVPVGRKWPTNVRPFNLIDYYTATTNASGNITINFSTSYQFNYAYGYFPFVQAGNSTFSLGQVVPVIASCTFAQLVVVCYQSTGSVVNTQSVSILINLFGA